MGIKNLTSFLQQNCPNAIKQTTLDNICNNFAPLKCAIDISIFLYRYKYKGNKLIPKLFEQINRLRINNITPVYIFDGAPTKEKLNTIIERKNKLIEKQKRIDALNDEISNTSDETKITEFKTQINNLNGKIISVTKDDIYQVKYLLDLLNIKYIQAKGEADSLCSKLCSTGIVDFVISEDMDLLTSGSKILVRDFNIYNNKITTYNLDIILSELNISYEKFVELCIMFGCDYVKRIKGMGPPKSYKCIKNYNCIEDVLKSDILTNKIVSPTYLNDFNNAKNIFMNYSIDYLENIDIKIEKLYDNQLYNIKSYLLKNTTLTNKQIDNRIKNIYKYI